MKEAIPRRIQTQLLTMAESAIRLAVAEVEVMGADVRLTDAVVLLQAARESVADFVDDVLTVRRGLASMPVTLGPEGIVIHGSSDANLLRELGKIPASELRGWNVSEAVIEAIAVASQSPEDVESRRALAMEQELAAETERRRK